MNIFLNKKYLDEHIKNIKKIAGARYTPELNVDLPIAEIFDGISRTGKFYEKIRRNYGKLLKEFKYIHIDFDDRDIQRTWKRSRNEIKDFFDLIGAIKKFDTNHIDWKKIHRKAKKLQNLLWEFETLLRDKKDSLVKLEVVKREREEKTKKQEQFSYRTSVEDNINNATYHLYKFENTVSFFKRFSTSVTAKLSNYPFLLLKGGAGTGKTHLLCDVAEQRIKEGKPIILLFGHRFESDVDMWKSVSHQIDPKNKYKIKKTWLFKRLNASGKQNNCRALLIVDALNESTDTKYWKNNLDKLIKEVRKYSNIALVVSVRSGFENQSLFKRQQKIFTEKIHEGFKFREWEAVTKFFKWFSLPFPEVPLLMPEFQHPLFLLLFCKAFKKRLRKKKKKCQVFRGHEGATYIFESFIDGVSDKIAEKFNIPKGAGKNIWDLVIEKMAELMVENASYKITQENLEDIVSNTYSKLNKKSFIGALEKGMLITKIPRYSRDFKNIEGFDYCFPFQKFSDHLIGRYIFKKYENHIGKKNKNLKTARRFFSKRTKIGKFVTQYNIGIIEALSIQCPEQLKGIEFVEVAPYLLDSHSARAAFIESLIWRKPDAFSSNLKNTFEYINKKVIYDEYSFHKLLDAFLTVAPIPNHPFNADFLHSYLSRFPMPKRDSWWLPFLHYQYDNYEERGAVDRLIEWAWSEHNKSHLNDEAILLSATAFGWFLASSNRFLRDKATKGLVSLLTDKINLLIPLLEKFKKVNDPYIAERLYAVTYGCTLRNWDKDKDGLKRLARWIYKEIFQNGTPPPHILLRDYARGTIENVLYNGIKIKIDRDKIVPPYKSKWPERIYTEATLKKKYYTADLFKGKTKNRGYLDIWLSVMGSGDFARYVIGTNWHHFEWSSRKLNEPRRPSRKEIYEKFIDNLTAKQKKLFNKAYLPVDINALLYLLEKKDSKDRHDIDEEEIKKETKELKKKFKKSLDKKQLKIYQNVVVPYLKSSKQDEFQFDFGIAQRWIFNRVIKFGWRPEIHGKFDERISYSRADRSAHKGERIGKKYQWIAYHEFLAIVSDNFEFKEASWSNKPGIYEGPWQLNVRDIDPSCTLKEFPNPVPEDAVIPTFGNYKKLIEHNVKVEKISNKTWLRRTNDLPMPKNIITVKDDGGDEWVILAGFVEWQEKTPPEREKYDVPTRRLWYMLKGYLVNKSAINKVFQWARKQNFMGRWMPESNEFYNIFLGEYPWAPAFLYHYIPYFYHDGWTDTGRKEKIPAKILVVEDQYLSSGSSIDCSTNEAIRVKLPAKWLVDKMKLEQKYIDGRFFDKKGKLVAFDPMVFDNNMPSVFLVKKEKLQEFLDKNGYSIFWTLLGEKNMIGGGVIGQPLWLLEINGVYTIDIDRDRKITGQITSEFKR